MTEFTNNLSKEVWETKYCWKEEKTIHESHVRCASWLASIEKNKKKYTEEFLQCFEDFKFLTGGRILSNGGTDLKTTAINCFVDGCDEYDSDSMESIYNTLQRQSVILKSEGGYGFNCDFMRPDGAFIGGIGNRSPGNVKFLELWDKSSEIITAGATVSKKDRKKNEKNFIRKGAQMVTCSCWHPGIVRFIEAKKTPGKLTKFNMSVLCNDAFMRAIKNNRPWKLVFPNYEKFPNEYKKHWIGNIEEWKDIIKNKTGSTRDSIVIYRSFDNANELWDMIMESTYNRNEPGVLFVDTINRMNNLYYCEYINSTNPCGEQVLPKGGVCLLGSINATQFVDLEKRDWDYEGLKKIIPSCIRMMDNVNDLTYVPLKSQRENLKNKRRIGLGVMGYASALMMMKVRYGSEESIGLTDKWARFCANECYRANALLAKEKGAFPLYDREKYLKSEFLKVLDNDVIELIKKYGVRCSHVLSIQPTGNSSVLANIVSGGLEPVYRGEYTRTIIQQNIPRGLKTPKNIDWEKCTHLDPSNKDDENVWHWSKEGDENILKTLFGKTIYKYDQNRGLTKEENVCDYAALFHKQRGGWNENADWSACIDRLSVDDHINVMSIFAKYIDSSMSKTLNMPNDYPYEDFKNVYMKAWETGQIKGFTSYREGTMTHVLSAKNIDKIITKTTSPKRPERLNCNIHHITYKGEKWIVIVGLLSDDPYEVFVFKAKDIYLPEDVDTGVLSKRKLVRKSKYDLEIEGHNTIKDIASCFETLEEESIARLLSISLRHGIDIEFLVDQLLKSAGTMFSFNRVVARVLKKYISTFNVMTCGSCHSKKLHLSEGCIKCLDCGMTKCD